MKREYSRPSGISLLIHRVLVGVLLAMAAVLVVGSLLAVFRSPDSKPLFTVRDRIAGGKESSEAPAGGETAMFTNIGRLRIPVAASATVILSINFPYPAADRLFAEELASHIGDFRSIATAYFSALSADQLALFNEDRAKTEILSRYNSLLRLGKIETLYISDFMVID